MIECINHLSQAEYRALPAISQSDLKKCWENPQLFDETRGEVSEPSSAQQWGITCEAWLRGDAKTQRVIPAECLNSAGHRKGKAWDWFKSQHADHAQWITPIEWQRQYEGFQTAVRNAQQHDAAALLVWSPTAKWNQRFLWEADGELLKCEMDLLDAELGAITDVKTAADVDPRSFEKDAVKFGYDVQAAMYLRAARLLDFDRDWVFAWVVIRNTAPHNVEVYQASEELLAFGEERLQRRIDFYQECRESNRWRSPTHGQIVTLYPPRYARELV